MAVPTKDERRNKPIRRMTIDSAAAVAEPKSPLESDFNEDDYLAGRISIGFVSRCSRRLSLGSQINSMEREVERTDRSSRNETRQKFNGSSTTQKDPNAKLEVNDRNRFVRDATRVQPIVDIRPSRAKIVQSGEELPPKFDVGEKVHSRQWRNNETHVVNNNIKRATSVKPVKEESVHVISTTHAKSLDRGKLDPKTNARAQPYVNTQVSVTPEGKKEKVCLSSDSKRRVDVEPGQSKTHHIRGTSKDALPVQINTREVTSSSKTNSKGSVRVNDNSDTVRDKFDIKDGQKPRVKVDSPHKVHCKRDETSVSPCNDDHKENEAEEKIDTDKVYNYLFYIGRRIPSKTFSRLCRSVNKQTMPSSSPSSLSSSCGTLSS